MHRFQRCAVLSLLRSVGPATATDPGVAGLSLQFFSTYYSTRLLSRSVVPLILTESEEGESGSFCRSVGLARQLRLYAKIHQASGGTIKGCKLPACLSACPPGYRTIQAAPPPPPPPPPLAATAATAAANQATELTTEILTKSSKLAGE